MSNAEQYNRGDIVTTDLPDQKTIDNLIALLIERGIQYRMIKLQGRDQILVPVSFTAQFAELANAIVNDLPPIGTFQDEFLTALYDDTLKAFVSYWEPVNIIPSIADLDAGKLPDEPEYNISVE